jgi:hypothetical protein
LSSLEGKNVFINLQANTQGTMYLLAVSSSGDGSAYVLATGRPVLYAGGFSSNDPVIDGTSLAALMTKGDVLYDLWGGAGPLGGGRGRSGNSTISSCLPSSCTVVTASTLTAGTGGGGGGGWGGHAPLRRGPTRDDRRSRSGQYSRLDRQDSLYLLSMLVAVRSS